GHGSRVNTIHCDICGEDYADIYRYCPFCEGIPPETDEEGEDGENPANRGGKRLSSNSRGGGYGRGPSPVRVVGIIISVALIVAAICIVAYILSPMLAGETQVDPTPSPASSDLITDEPVDTEGNALIDVSAAPVMESPASSADVNTIPADQTATDFTLSHVDVTLNNESPSFTLKPTFIPADGTATVTYTSSDAAVASVDENGKVTGHIKGTVTITASIPGGVSHSCLVRCSFSGTATSGTLTLNHDDFTIQAGESVQMKASGVTGTPVWSIGNTSVATISSSGVVTHVGKGTTTITCTVDGQTAQCIVRAA
ncbi:MAG: Ig-like domain-containing protein, partial [Oscillospiraceae bacterium]|nr:Ig-like domain-containing protein [Oscillospiraceae bacterium]